MRTRMAKTLTYTTEHMSADLTFATCSHGPDLDPDIHILTRRAVALRRYYTRMPGGAYRSSVEIPTCNNGEGISANGGVVDVGASSRSDTPPHPGPKVT